MNNKQPKVKMVFSIITLLSLAILASCTQETSNSSGTSISQDVTQNEPINQNSTVNQTDEVNPGTVSNQVDTIDQQDNMNQQDTSSQNNPAQQNESPIFLHYEEGTKVSDLVTDAAGGVHVTYQSQYAVDDITPIYYAYCPSDCGAPTRWTAVPVGDAGLGTAAVLAVTSSGQPRLVWYYQQKTNGDGTYIYAACDQNCVQFDNWTRVPVAATKSRSQRNLALSPEGNPRFLYTDINGSSKELFYAYCDTNCTDPANWPIAKIWDNAQLSDINLVADSAGTLHMLFNFDNTVVGYAQCAADCAAAVNWRDIPTFDIGLEASIALAITDDNKPRFAFNTGSLDHQTYYAWCAADCALDQKNWLGMPVGLGEFEGQQLDLALNDQNQPHIAYHSQNLALGYVACSADCETGQPVWNGRYIETAAELNANQQARPGCSLQSWNVGEFPSIAVDNRGNSLVSYDAMQKLGGCRDERRVRFAVIETQ